MPLIEIDDAAVAAMQANGVRFTDRTAESAAAQKVLAAIRAIENGPNRQAYLRVLKQQYPEMVIPELDAAKPVNDAVAALDKKFDDYITEQKKQAEERTAKERETLATKTVDQGRSWLKREKKMDEDGVKAVEEIMQGEGIPNYQAAFLLWRDRNPPVEVDLPAVGSRSLDWFKAETEESAADIKLRLADPIKYRQKRVPQLLQQLRRGEIDEFGRPLKAA